MDQRSRKLLRVGTLTLDEAVEKFIESKQAEGMRERTIKDYSSHISYLKAFLDDQGYQIEFVSELTTDIIRKYILYMKTTNKYKGVRKREQEGGLKINTINIRLRTLKAMCIFWYREGLIDENPMKNIGQFV